MPYARITLHRGRTQHELRAIADAVYQAMHESLGAPANDRFQMIHQLDPGEFIYDLDYLGGPRSDGFIHVALTIGRPREAEAKQRFYRQRVQLLGQGPAAVDPEDVMIVIQTTQPEDWSFGGGRQGITPAAS